MERGIAQNIDKKENIRNKQIFEMTLLRYLMHKGRHTPVTLEKTVKKFQEK